MNKNMVYFVMYIVLIVELLIVIAITGLVFSGLLLLFNVCAAAQGEGGGAGAPQAQGIKAWIAALYRENRLLYGLLSVLIVLIVGALLGVLTEAVLALLGRGTKPIEHIE